MKRPNIVFVFADQMRASSLGCMGREKVITPNLDHFASEGILFSRAISNHPICCPARATILTGLHSTNHGLVTNDQQLRTNVKTLAHHLSDEGYSCGYIGKWHMDCIDRGAFIPPGSRRRGFDDFWAVNSCNHDYLNAYYYLNDNPEPVWVEGYEPEAQTDIAINYMRQKSREDSSFCLFLSWGPPHCPYRHVPQKYLDMYPEEKIQLKPNAVESADRSVIAGYYAHITALDDQFGRLMNTIDQMGIRDNTIVIFTSDHGDMLFSQNKGWKMKPWSESVNIPFIARWPGRIPEGKSCDAPIGLVDVMPTLLGLANAQVPEGIDGRDLSKLFRGDEADSPVSQFIYNIIGYKGWSDGFNEWRGVVTKTHTYARLRDTGWLLYHDAEDPYQLINRIDDPEYAEARDQLEAELQKWLEATNDPFYSPDEAIAQYVTDRIIVSEDKEELIPCMESGFGQMSHIFNPSGNFVPEDLSHKPDENRFVKCFENEKIFSGKSGKGRKLFHRDFFDK